MNSLFLRLNWMRPLSVLAMFGVWQGLSWLADSATLPAPIDVAHRFALEWQLGELTKHLSVTLLRVLLSFLCAMAAGLLLGSLMASSKYWDAFLDSPLTLGLNLPALVVIILCFVWIGLNELAVIIAVVLNKTPTMAVIFREGVKTIDRGLMEVAQVHGLSRRKTLWRIWLPQLQPFFLAATRSGLALVWKIVLVVELLGANQGMGFKLGEFFQFFEIDGILAYSAAFIIVIALAEALVVRPWERRLARWRSA